MNPHPAWEVVYAVGRFLRLFVLIGFALLALCCAGYGCIYVFQLLDQGNHPAWVALQDHVTKHVAEYLGTLHSSGRQQ